MPTSLLIEQLCRHEGFSPHVYNCTEGFRTIGYGYNLDKGMSRALALKILVWEVEEVEVNLSKVLPFWGKLSPKRQEVLTNMAFNLGVGGLLGFRRMLAAAERGNIESVCNEMENSKWFSQVGSRAEELIEQYRKG